MALEIERRFLVDPQRLPRLRKGKKQIQGYFSFDPKNSEIELRVRIEDKKATLTLKSRVSNLVRREFEYKIPLKEGLELLKLTDKKVVKVRHNLLLKGKKWVVDFFQEKNFPLVVAEIELKNEKEEFSPPLWITQEVTDKLSYTARALSFKPFQMWTKKDLKKNS